MYEDMTANGRTFYDRAKVAFEERMPVEMTAHELIKSLLDFRTIKFGEAQYLTHEEIKAAVKHLQEAYVECCMTAHRHRMGKSPSPEPNANLGIVRSNSVLDDIAEERGPSGNEDEAEKGLIVGYEQEFRTAFTQWRQYANNIVYTGRFGAELGGKNESDLDIVDDLINLDMSSLYQASGVPHTESCHSWHISALVTIWLLASVNE